MQLKRMKMIKGKARIIFLCASLFTIVILVYRSFGDDRSYQSQTLNTKTDSNVAVVSKAPNKVVYQSKEDLVVPLTLLPATERIAQESSAQQNTHLDLSVAANVILPKRLVHLDLKGAPPRASYLKQLFPFIRSLGATGVLLEYEDMFPYWGKLENVRAYNSYTEEEIQDILHTAEDNGLEIIPLIQTFGHLEFFLKLEDYKDLREVPAFPQAVCPSNNRSVSLLLEMVDQVLKLHPKATHLHIGCDEVYNIGECPLCQDRLSKMGWNPNNLFLSHVSTITRYVKTKHIVQPIMWDDMFRHVSEEAIIASEIGKYTDILVWKYTDEVEAAIGKEIWNKYLACFTGIWIASAFKGADTPSSYATPIQERLLNHQSWVKLLQNYPNLPIKGIFLTGWQRYDHFSTLCELLPAGLPSLAVNLQFLTFLTYNYSVAKHVQNLLGCNREVPLFVDGSYNDVSCSFPGSRVYELSLNLVLLNQYLDENFFKSNYVKGWLTPYNIDNKFSSPALLEQANMRLMDGFRNFSLFRIAMSEALSGVYDNYTVNEWIDTIIRPILDKLESYQTAIHSLLTRSVWPLRPLNFHNDDDNNNNNNNNNNNQK